MPGNPGQLSTYDPELKKLVVTLAKERKVTYSRMVQMLLRLGLQALESNPDALDPVLSELKRIRDELDSLGARIGRLESDRDFKE